MHRALLVRSATLLTMNPAREIIPAARKPRAAGLDPAHLTMQHA